MTAQEAIKKVTEAITTLEEIIASYHVLQGLTVSVADIRDMIQALKRCLFALKIKGYDELVKALEERKTFEDAPDYPDSKAEPWDDSFIDKEAP